MRAALNSSFGPPSTPKNLRQTSILESLKNTPESAPPSSAGIHALLGLTNFVRGESSNSKRTNTPTPIVASSSKSKAKENDKAKGAGKRNKRAVSAELGTDGDSSYRPESSQAAVGYNGRPRKKRRRKAGKEVEFDHQVDLPLEMPDDSNSDSGNGITGDDSSIQSTTTPPSDNEPPPTQFTRQSSLTIPPGTTNITFFVHSRTAAAWRRDWERVLDTHILSAFPQFKISLPDRIPLAEEEGFVALYPIAMKYPLEVVARKVAETVACRVKKTGRGEMPSEKELKITREDLEAVGADLELEGRTPEVKEIGVEAEGGGEGGESEEHEEPYDYDEYEDWDVDMWRAGSNEEEDYTSTRAAAEALQRSIDFELGIAPPTASRMVRASDENGTPTPAPRAIPASEEDTTPEPAPSLMEEDTTPSPTTPYQTAAPVLTP